MSNQFSSKYNKIKKFELHVIFIVMLFLLFTHFSFSQYSSPNEVIVREIVIDNLGVGQIDRSYVLTHLSQKVGDKLDYGLVSADVRDILKTGIISDVKVDAAELPNGVKLIYSLHKRLRLDRIVAISGEDHFRESKLRNWLGLEVGDYIDDQVMGVKIEKLLKEYHDDKYPYVDITWKIIETDNYDGRGKVKIIINEGHKAKLKKVKFVGNDNISREDLKKIIGVKPWWNPFGWWGRKYVQNEINLANDNLRNYYIGQGFLDAQIDKPTIDMYKKGKYRLTFDINEGMRYKFGKIDIEGMDIFPKSDLEHRVVCRNGATALGTSLQASIRGVTDFYGGKGYAGTYVEPIIIPNVEKGTVAVSFKVHEGVLTHIRNIKIRGNTRTRDKVIRRELLVYPGELYNTVKIRRSERIIQNLGFFSTVHSFAEKALSPDEKDLILEVTEKRTGQFMMGAGFSSVDKLVGFIEISQGNFDFKGWPYFTGGGQKLKLRLQFGSRRSSYSLSFTEPWFLNRRLSLGFDLFRSDVDYNDYSLKRTGGAVKLGKALPGPNRIDFRYQLVKKEEYDIADTNAYYYTDDSADEYYFATDTDYVKSSLRVAITHDTRNNPFVPSRGNRSSVFSELSGGPLGFDLEIYRIGGKVRQYFPLWFGHVLSFKGEAEIVDEYGGTEEMPIAERLFLGGGRNLRGFEYRDVGPKVARKIPTDNGEIIDYRPVGGRSMLMGSLEYTIPLLSMLRIAGFYDVGNVWRDAYDFDFSRLASSVGIGLRIDMPGFPIRIDRAWVISKDDELTNDDPWVFWIGYDF